MQIAQELDACLVSKSLPILQHALGLDQYGRGASHRNHFVACEESEDAQLCRTLAAHGLMIEHRASDISGGDPVFMVTRCGRAFVGEKSPSPPKLTAAQRRYEDFLSCDGVFESFGDYLRYIERKRKDARAGLLPSW